MAYRPARWLRITRLAGLVAANLGEEPLAAPDALGSWGRAHSAADAASRGPRSAVARLPPAGGPPPVVKRPRRRPSGLAQRTDALEPPDQEPDLVGVALEHTQQLLAARHRPRAAARPMSTCRPSSSRWTRARAASCSSPAVRAIRPASSRARSASSSRPASIRTAPRPVWVRARRVVRWEERRRPLEQADGGRGVAAGVRSRPGRLQVAGGAAGQRPDLPVDRLQLVPVSDRLLQVVADDLVLAGLVLDDAGEALVQLGAVQPGWCGRPPAGPGDDGT